ncbi:MAG TPA: GGDEF domain-containing protein [Acidobacteriaceae bacterium]|jgi:diguanylate cyclase (GGDEF)-like protein|nr:GGDEF domain-containing protein [Acidobacteriaceae bacterium]
METRIILIVGSILLCCGCIGLLIVRLSNPFFKGLGWLGGAFAAGGVGAGILVFNISATSGVSVLIADTLILLAYVFLHLCILELTENKVRLPRLGITLLVVQAIAYPVFRSFNQARGLCVVTLGCLLAIQALQSAAQLRKSAKAKVLPHIWFSTLLLVGFACFNVFRSVAVLSLGTPQDPLAPNPFEALAAIVFLSVGLGLGFGMFWMASAEIRLKLEALANTDSLTGLCNRRSFLTWCDRELLISTRTKKPFSLILIDLDNFKQINDSYGHHAGDAALCSVVEKLRHGVRNIDVLGRWGGEEFVVLLPGATSVAALRVAQRLRGSVASLQIVKPAVKAAGDGATITISQGVATYLGDGDTIDDLLRRCDSALYQAKADGRNRVVQKSV